MIIHLEQKNKLIIKFKKMDIKKYILVNTSEQERW